MWRKTPPDPRTRSRFIHQIVLATKLQFLTMANLITVYWRDIPAQVMAKERRTSAKVELSSRFSEAIDHAAMRAGLVGTDAYLEQWRRVSAPCGDDLETIAREAAARLEADYDRERLLSLIRNEGREPAV